MKLSFKKRIALFNTIAVATTTAIIFIVIYGVVYYTSLRHPDNDIVLEKEEILNPLDWKQDGIIINKLPEWEKAEHKKVEANPTFIQIIDNNCISLGEPVGFCNQEDGGPTMAVYKMFTEINDLYHHFA